MTITAHKVQSSKIDFSWKAASSLLAHIKTGQLTIHYNDESTVFGEQNSDGPIAEITVHDGQLFREMLTGGDIAAAECYADGLWDSPDLTKVVQFFAANIPHEKKRFTPFAAITRTGMKFAHWLNQNTIKGSKRNIQAHYDLGNDLFLSFLDASMMYSAAIYPNANATLEEAQQYRLQRICEKLRLSSTNHLLEIGTGWGSMAIYAAKHTGCRVTTTTISEEQYQYAVNRVKEEGLTSLVTVLKTDYRDLTGQYDRLVSIEMIEAVGHKYLAGYFEKINDLVTEDGIALLQAITIPDQRYKAYRSSVDFIRKFIFPGGHLPSISQINHHIGNQTTMTVNHFEDITDHYARTLKDWHARFIANYSTLNHDKYTRQFYRMWRYYFAYCEGGFNERSIGTSQIVFSKSQAKYDWVL